MMDNLLQLPLQLGRARNIVVIYSTNDVKTWYDAARCSSIGV